MRAGDKAVFGWSNVSFKILAKAGGMSKKDVRYLPYAATEPLYITMPVTLENFITSSFSIVFSNAAAMKSINPMHIEGIRGFGSCCSG
jgi:hypothetical protein